MIASIQKENGDPAFDASDHVQQRHRLRLERRAHRDLGPEPVHGPLDDLLRGLRLKFF